MGAKRNKSRTSVPPMNVQTPTIFNPDYVSGTEDSIVDVEQTICDESELPVKKNTTEKAEKVNSFSSN
jgi:hypothetical protein